MQPVAFTNRYLTLKPLGEGGMGSVWLARNLGSDALVAVKMLHPSLAPDPTQRARFYREAYAAVSLRNEHIIQVFEVGALPDGVPFLVMEYLQGLDLGALLEQRGPFPVEAAVGYVAQACAGLAGAHAAGIIHRDLKPANLLLLTKPDGSPLVKVLDFGVARVASSGVALTGVNAVVGSPRCMAPEQYDGRSGELTAAADVWALGCILYKLLEGTYPYEGETLGELLVNLATAPMRPFARPDVPEGLKQVVWRCLALDAGQRYANAGELVRALSPWAPAWAPFVEAAHAVNVPVGTAPMAGAEMAVAGGRRRELKAWQAIAAAGGALAGGAIALAGALFGGCAWLFWSSLPAAGNHDLEETLNIADTKQVDPIELLPQVEAAARRLDRGAMLVQMNTSVQPPGLVNTGSGSSLGNLNYTFATPNRGRMIGVVIKGKGLWARRSMMRSELPQALGSTWCTLAEASRAAHAAGLGTNETSISLVYDQECGFYWKIGANELFLDGHTCARIPPVPP